MEQGNKYRKSYSFPKEHLHQAPRNYFYQQIDSKFDEGLLFDYYGRHLQQDSNRYYSEIILAMFNGLTVQWVHLGLQSSAAILYTSSSQNYCSHNRCLIAMAPRCRRTGWPLALPWDCARITWDLTLFWPGQDGGIWERWKEATGDIPWHP